MRGDMSRFKINRKNKYRCLLTEVSPYETPLIFSNWGSYHYFHTLKKNNPPQFLAKLMIERKYSIPFNFQYFKNKNKKRTLSLIHPNSSERIAKLYNDFDLYIINLCRKSSFSIRYPHSIAKYYTVGRSRKNEIKEIEQLDENSRYASSYFSYMNFSHLHKYFESVAFSNIEKRYIYETHVDISKCFPSIYTHSISWAIRGKENTKRLNFSKDRSFGARFDHFMQYINYQETNGIVVGPEFSRIFAELILQNIDCSIERKMMERDHVNELSFQCIRYLDDFYFYYNDESVLVDFIEILENELEVFKLYINEKKIETSVRPFISKISIKKIAISRYVDELIDKIQNVKKTNSQREINRIREILNFDNNENHAVTNYFISILINKIHIFKSDDKKRRYLNLKLLNDIVSYLIFMDARVSSLVKYTKYILVFLKVIESLSLNYKKAIKDQIFYELTELLKLSNSKSASIESLNIIIILNELTPDYMIDKKILEDTLNSFKKSKCNTRLKYDYNYFEMISILYYIKEKRIYSSIKNKIIKCAKEKLENECCLKYSESAYLVLDLLSCPYLDNDIKLQILESGIKNSSLNISKNNKLTTISYISNHSWYTNWNIKDNLKNILKKKEFMLSY